MHNYNYVYKSICWSNPKKCLYLNSTFFESKLKINNDAFISKLLFISQLAHKIKITTVTHSVHQQLHQLLESQDSSELSPWDKSQYADPMRPWTDHSFDQDMASTTDITTVIHCKLTATKDRGPHKNYKYQKSILKKIN